MKGVKVYEKVSRLCSSVFNSFSLKHKLYLWWHILYRWFDVVFSFLASLAVPVAFAVSVPVAFGLCCLLYIYGLAGAVAGLFGGFSWVFVYVVFDKRRQYMIHLRTGWRSDDCSFSDIDVILKELHKTKRL